MKDLFPDDRPREKLWQHGASALGDNELVALVIAHGGRHGSALALANALLAANDGLHGLSRCTCDDLAHLAGIGPSRAAQIVAALELGRRTLTHAPAERIQLGSPNAAALYLLPRFGGRALEQFGLILLDTKHRVIRTTVLASGTQNASHVEPRDVFREAARGGAAAIVVFHTHPSGDPTPSPDDVELTHRLVSAGVIMGIDVVDHIVLGDVRYCSFKESQRL
ncbi:MAG TPA: DNA repair protein RadC [Vicinamibacterales bacterium]|jgi:DNA repair protein RadC|nr:DNA repair protein RadC [Vicinamibacterales bacterium]